MHETFNVSQCHHIEGSENPADSALRGINPSELKDHELWWNGPKFLGEKGSSWVQELELPEVALELRTKFISTNVITSDKRWKELIVKYSSFDRLVKIIAIGMKFVEQACRTKKFRITALCLTFINNVRSKIRKPQLLITTQNLKKAEKRIIRLCQSKVFDKEIHHLSSGRPTNKSKILSLNPFLDADGCLRVCGRLEEANMSYGRKHPIIVPEGIIAKLIIVDAHERSLHVGVKLTICLVRERFWIINLRKQVKKCIFDC